MLGGEGGGEGYHALGCCLSRGACKTIANLLGSIFSQLNILVNITSCKVDQRNDRSGKLTVQYQRVMLTNCLLEKMYTQLIFTCSKSTKEVLDTPQRG